MPTVESSAKRAGSFAIIVPPWIVNPAERPSEIITALRAVPRQPLNHAIPRGIYKVPIALTRPTRARRAKLALSTYHPFSQSLVTLSRAVWSRKWSRFAWNDTEVAVSDFSLHLSFPEAVFNVKYIHSRQLTVTFTCCEKDCGISNNLMDIRVFYTLVTNKLCLRICLSIREIEV